VFGMIMGAGLNIPADRYLAQSPYLRSYFG
jgi:hypothetical protein